MSEPFVGNSAARSLLDRTMRGGRLAHGYLFTGPSGLGKRRLALNLAQALNCETGPAGLDPCGQCPACRKIDAESHPDVRSLAPENRTFKVEQVRELVTEIQYQPFEGRRRVFILDEADRMSEPAANCLLKTLEEPPGSSLLILVANNAHSLLATIRSRCQEIRFAPIPLAELTTTLVERHGHSPETARRLAILAQGSLGRALSVDPAAALELEQWAFGLVKRVADNDEASLIAHVHQLAPPPPRKTDPGRFESGLSMLAAVLRDLSVVGHSREPDLLLHPAAGERLRALQQALDPAAPPGLFDGLQAIRRKEQQNIRPDLALLNLALAWQRPANRRPRP